MRVELAVPFHDNEYSIALFIYFQSTVRSMVEMGATFYT
jgi:hypothetical protein